MSHLNYIKHRLSLRAPLQVSLDIVADVAETLIFDKKKQPEDKTDYFAAYEQGMMAQYPTYRKNEWDFPSMTMSIATGVGKTRLMGAMMAWLYLEKGVRNFFVLAPNLTIYNKLIEDFGNPSYHKYVFTGIAEFVHNRPVVITGDNYAQQAGLFSENEIRINVFNIAKFNSDNKATKEGGRSKAPRMKRISEYLGQSYWEYLCNLPDLVLLMDEAHRYRAASSTKAVNELSPVLGIELTATPFYGDRGVFRNVAYEYSLSDALRDAFVKNIYIGTRANFNPKGLTAETIDQASLEAAHTRHQDTKLELERYALEQNKRRVKPFILVVCKDTTHAANTAEFLTSKAFFDGEYKGKVLQIDSTTRTDEEIEKQFLTLENAENEIEIVIHVNMLKEGWDVTNLYTIVVLRKADAKVLVEQTIGRGLRLPYEGARTGVEKVDALTIIEHYNFEEVVKEAADKNSILNRAKFLKIGESTATEKAEIITTESVFIAEKKAEQVEIKKMENEEIRVEKLLKSDAQIAVYTLLQTANKFSEVNKMEDLTLPTVQEKIIKQYEKALDKGQQTMFKSQLLAEAKAVYAEVVKAFRAQVIEIPRIRLVPQLVEPHFAAFELDTSILHYRRLEEYLQIYELQSGFRVDVLSIEKNKSNLPDPKEYILSLLLDFPEIQYDNCGEMAAAFAEKAVQSLLADKHNNKDIRLIVQSFGRVIARNIYDQMMQHYTLIEGDYLPPIVLPFTGIEPHHNTNFVYFGFRHYREIITPTSAIPKYLFEGFKKSAHERYRFDSKVEKDFAQLLEDAKEVEKWLRPAKKQFNIYINNQQDRYVPDFVVETEHKIYFVETKGADRLQSEDVKQKTKAALLYCQNASIHTAQHDGKPWSYLLIPHDEVRMNSSFDYLVERFEVR